MIKANPKWKHVGTYVEKVKEVVESEVLNDEKD